MNQRKLTTTLYSSYMVYLKFILYSNHLDLEACVWLENYLAKYDRCLVVVSHSADFLNGVCTNILHITEKRQFRTYGGNYDVFMQTKAENEVNQQKMYVTIA